MATAIAPVKLASRLSGWLQCYRLTVPDELVSEYARTLRDLSEAELDAALEAAKRESVDFAPTPGRVLEIAAELRKTTHEPIPEECELCKGTGFHMIVQSGARLAERCPCRGRYMPTVGVKGDWWEKLLDGTDRRLREMERK